jgi:hypothetical protein
MDHLHGKHMLPLAPHAINKLHEEMDPLHFLEPAGAGPLHSRNRGATKAPPHEMMRRLYIIRTGEKHHIALIMNGSKWQTNDLPGQKRTGPN